MKKLLSIMTITAAGLTLAACKSKNTGYQKEQLTYSGVLNIDFAGDSGQGYIKYAQTSAWADPISGKTYTSGDLTPTWAQVKTDLTLTTLNDLTNYSNSMTQKNRFDTYISKGFGGVDLLGGNGSDINNYGTAKQQYFVPLNYYWDELPNFRKFLDKNPAYEKAITAGDGNIYFAPNFDGVDDIMRMFMLRHDFVKILIDQAVPANYDTVTGTGDDIYDTDTTITAAFKQYYADSYDAMIPMANADKVSTTLVKKTVAVNPLKRQAAAELNGKNTCKALRDHITATGLYGESGNPLSNYFIGDSPAYDADDLIALFRCVKTNPRLLTNAKGATEKPVVVPFFTRDDSASRFKDVEMLASMWATRGLDTADAASYIGEDGKVYNRKGEKEMIDSLDRMNQMYKEGLIVQNFDGKNSVTFRDLAFTSGNYFMSFDYNASSTDLYDTKYTDKNASTKNIDFQSVLPPVAKWFGGNWSRYTESVRTVKSNSWAVPTAAVNKGEAIKLIDFAWSKEGSDLLNFGPAIYHDGTIDYKGEKFPKFKAYVTSGSDKFIIDGKEVRGLKNLAGSGTNANRRYLGSTLPLGSVKSLANEFQFLHTKGEESVNRINRATTSGVLGYQRADATEIYKRVTPGTYPLTGTQNKSLSANATFTTEYDNTYTLIIKNGFTGSNINGVTDAATYLTYLQGKGYNQYWKPFYNEAWTKLNK